MGSVLVVDDDPDGREALCRLLARAGYAVRSAPNGRDALIALTTQQPDVVILDAMMPEMDGVTFLGVVRSYLRWGNLPVILLTAYPEGEHIDRARELGVKRIFLKASYQASDLLSCVEKLAHDPSSECAAG
jgi:CheY-like chemotaxis protein